MRISLRLIVSLAIAITLVSVLFAMIQVRNESLRKREDLDRRARVFAESLRETMDLLPQPGSQAKLREIVEKFGSRESLAGVIVYGDHATPLLITSALARKLNSRPPPLDKLPGPGGDGGGSYIHIGPTEMHRYVIRLPRQGALAVFHDASFIETEASQTWRETFLRVLIQMALIVAITILVVRWTIVGHVLQLAQWIRDLRNGKPTLNSGHDAQDVFKPLTKEVSDLALGFHRARASAEEEARLRDAADSLWTAERLKVYLRSTMEGRPFFAVSNREPYIHQYKSGYIETIVPASGLVTAMEPILCASNGTWIAQGSGDADRATADERNRVSVPPGDPKYTLRRVWLSQEEEDGYYYGFSNEGIWPLCHIAHTRPVFRLPDWESYQEANRKFADAVLDEIRDAENPIVLVQDYHFALLPRLIKEARPDANVAIFWHIPWPNPEAFGICPWQHELLEGLLGADLIGFHIQEHCRNFLDTVDRCLESRTEWERGTVTRGSHLTIVKPFPISVELPASPAHPVESDSLYVERESLLRKYGIRVGFIGIGVDRLDYTKGIPERFHGIERFLEQNPFYVGRFTFIQIAAPTRTRIPRYQAIGDEVEQEAARINNRFQTSHWKPIVLFASHHSHQEIEAFYRAADVCLVTSLHDGMNLVAKEFVASRSDGGGVVILSRFAGASHELLDALIVNPYDTAQIAKAIQMALELPPEERRGRMLRLRRVVRENNIYRWAAGLIGAVSGIRLEVPLNGLERR